MIEYRCPKCRKMHFKADGPIAQRVVVRCRKTCGDVTPVASSGGFMVRVYRCEACRREQTCVNPTNDRAYCIPCGTPTLAIIAEHDLSATERQAIEPLWSSR